MLETTEKERAHFLDALKLMTEDQIGSPPVSSRFLQALCRDVDKLVGLLGELPPPRVTNFVGGSFCGYCTVPWSTEPMEHPEHCHWRKARAVLGERGV